MVYLDSVFALNAAVDYALCLLTARLAGAPLRRGRYLLAACLGGVYGAAVFLPETVWLSSLPVQIAAGGLMTLIAYGKEDNWLRLTLLFWLISCGLAGAVLGLSLVLRRKGGGILALSGAALCLALWLAFRSAVENGAQGKLLSVRVCVGGKVVSGVALRDTGNRLRDPISGQPVLILAPGKAGQLLPAVITEIGFQDPTKALEQLQSDAPELRPRLLPYRSMGKPFGLLLTIRADWVEVQGIREEGIPVALAPSRLGEGYDALWGGTDQQGGKHEGLGNTLVAAAEKKLGSRAGGPLHRRQRCPSTAADPGAGGVLIGAHRADGGAAGADRA